MRPGAPPAEHAPRGFQSPGLGSCSRGRPRAAAPHPLVPRFLFPWPPNCRPGARRVLRPLRGRSLPRRRRAGVGRPAALRRPGRRRARWSGPAPWRARRPRCAAPPPRSSPRWPPRRPPRRSGDRGGSLPRARRGLGLAPPLSHDVASFSASFSSSFSSSSSRARLPVPRRRPPPRPPSPRRGRVPGARGAPPHRGPRAGGKTAGLRTVPRARAAGAAPAPPSFASRTRSWSRPRRRS
mmetsp:Transcript_67215/g.151982  ORF Transcript_67215/g.151982 Transcript_67215/m.151982 type:complete len:238 (-) Transcript_67215:799-1512(-)